jgi:hypothetical protein
MKKRNLTPGEIDLAKTLFGDAIDYTQVKIFKIKYMPFQGKNVSMAPNGHIYFNNNYREDFSKENTHLQAHFIHEMTHVWQYQNHILNPKRAFAKELLQHKFKYAAAYSYTLDQNKDLLDYGMEQQATIVQDYFHLTQKNPDQAKSYEAVLKKFLKDPTYGCPKNKGLKTARIFRGWRA